MKRRAASGCVVTSGPVVETDRPLNRCGGSSGQGRAVQALAILIPVELSRRNASTSTNAGHDNRALPEVMLW